MSINYPKEKFEQAAYCFLVLYQKDEMNMDMGHIQQLRKCLEIVEDVAPFWDNMTWIEEKFGKPAIVQKPESMQLIPPDNDGNYVDLMVFPDGNRIDLTITSSVYEDNGEPAVLLLDKDGTFPKIIVERFLWNLLL